MLIGEPCFQADLIEQNFGDQELKYKIIVLLLNKGQKMRHFIDCRKQNIIFSFLASMPV